VTAPTDVAATPGFLASPPTPIDLSRTDFPPPLRSAGRLTVLDITKFFGDTTGGIRTYLLAKARYVQQTPSLHQVLVVPGAADALAEEGGVRCYRLRGPRIPFDPSYRFLLATRTTHRIFEHERPDIVEIGSPWLVPWVTRLANRGIRAPLVWFYHTHFPLIFDPGLADVAGYRRTAARTAWRYARLVASVCRATLVASDGVARELERHGVPRVRRVELGVDLECFHPTRRATARATRQRYGLPDAPLALYLGRFAEEKRLETVLAAWRTVSRRTGGWLVLVGAGPREPRLRALAEGQQVRWIPFQRNREDVADLLAACDLYLAPGPAETFGLSALEAMASGTPVLAVDAGGVAERVRASGAGAVYALGDPGACAEAATAMLTGDLRGLGRAARVYAEQHHAWNRAFEGIFRVYRQLLTRPA
jgi:alpha-1,6-mannosyltransferase